MTRYLLDANMISVMARDPRGRIARRARLLGFDALCTSMIVAGEIRFGLLRKNSRELEASLAPIMDRLSIEAFEEPAEARYAEVRADLQRRGKLIGSNDMLIAGHALALDCTLVSANTDEFARVAGLRLENWLIAASA